MPYFRFLGLFIRHNCYFVLSLISPIPDPGNHNSTLRFCVAWLFQIPHASDIMQGFFFPLSGLLHLAHYLPGSSILLQMAESFLR